MPRTFQTACNRDCPDGCGLVASVDQGKVVRLGGDPAHPVTQGFLCRRTSRYLQRQYSPDRITRAMIRRDKSRPDSWQAVSLDGALDLIAQRLLECRDRWGGASILNYRCGGSLGMMKSVTDYFFQRFGPVTIKSGDVCAGAGNWAQETDFGLSDSNDLFDLLNARTIVLWGKNVYVSQVHLLPILKRCKEAGARLILIDPIRHRTARLCDEFVAVDPGGDAALAFGMARWLMDRNRFDPDADRYCRDLDRYQALIGRRETAQWAQLAGVDPDQLAHLADTYSRGPSSILIGWGMQRRANGAAIVRAIDALAAVSGNLGRPGAGASFYYGRKAAFDLSFIDPLAAPRKISEPELGRGIEAASDPPIQMAFISCANPVTNLPDSATVARALTDRFTVVTDMFLTDTARCADVFLPAASMLEDEDLIGAYGHHYLNVVRPVVDPPGDALTDYQIVHQLARRVGLEDEFPDDPAPWKTRITRRLTEQGIELPPQDNVAVRNPFAARVLFEDRRFPTEDGRVHLVTEYMPPCPAIDDAYPLRLMAISTDRAQCAQWSVEDQQGLAQVTIHPSRAGGIHEGDPARLESRHGSIPVVVRFQSDQHPDLALMDKGGWLSMNRCPNALITAATSDYGQCAQYYDTPVRLVKGSEAE